MPIPLTAFLDKIAEIDHEHPTYREGGIARDGTCDCVGMIIAAMYRAGRAAYPLKSSNYIARYQIDDMSDGITEADVYAGMVVFKRREPGNAKYALPTRDQEGGRYYNGDLTDYYHIGVVTGASPLVITHCTSGGGVNGITKDYKLGVWSCGGKLKGIHYETNIISEEGTNMSLAGKSCKVTGGALNLRVSESVSSARIIQIPEGTLVYCYVDDGIWSCIKYDADEKTYTGYVRSEFLIEAEDQNSDPDAAESGTATGTTGTAITLTAAEVEAIRLMASIAAKL